MYNDMLELPRRVIATARIGVRPAVKDVEAAYRFLMDARRAMQFDGRSAVALDNARAVLSVLRHGYMPHRDACISAVASLGSTLIDPAPVDLEGA